MSHKSETRDFLWFLVKLVVIVVAIRSLLVAPFNIPSESMQPRLLIGDYLLVSKWSYGYSRYSFPFQPALFEGRVMEKLPERGDVVVFASPNNPKEDWIKRVIGLPGDYIQMQDGVVHLNGKAVPRRRIDDLVIPVTANMQQSATTERSLSPCFMEEYEFTDAKGEAHCRYPRYRETLPNGKSYEVLDLIDGPADNSGVYVVPEGHVFVMGDNRDRSADSRIPAEADGVGALPVDHLIGRALVSFFSTDGSASLLLPWTWFTAARPERIGEGF
ncbi:MAG: signal peptidase I [Alphaproteobacteria bacterium]|nr:signal peptidase I [Alphaproteobacteria bacterium]MBU0793256.1 signal peptidase I [Alphaproteobacteria bacterium]MBU0876775.1 signal peptidase I [Alphaproteobacteria bacterium]MBU1771229.1 signal peptidase I [Alphaproteobacteria bacterium]